MRNFKTEGIIIKRRNYKDSDRILTVLTKTHGKIYVKATGVRKITSRRAGHIELLNYSILTLYQGTAFPVLTEVATINNFSDLKKDLTQVGHIYHLCELIDGLCPENQENVRVFDLLKQTLDKLVFYCHSERSANGVEESLAPDFIERDSSTTVGMTKDIVNEFEVQLLTTLGYLSADRQDWTESNFLSAQDTEHFIENILERKLKSRKIFAKLQA